MTHPIKPMITTIATTSITMVPLNSQTLGKVWLSAGVAISGLMGGVADGAGASWATGVGLGAVVTVGETVATGGLNVSK